MKRTKPGKAAYSVRQTAELMGLGLNQTYAGCKSGEIPAIRVGNRWIVPRAALDRLLGRDADSAA